MMTMRIVLYIDGHSHILLQVVCIREIPHTPSTTCMQLAGGVWPKAYTVHAYMVLPWPAQYAAWCRVTGGLVL